MMIAVVIPTYNEKENIMQLIPKIFKVLKKNAFAIIVDDNSPDGTAYAVKSLQKIYPVYLVKRSKKLGLGSAYVKGFKRALEKRTSLIFQIDADLSHDPKYMLKFVKKINEGYDVVVGSRYVKGGGIVGWNFTRRFISWGGNLIGKYIAGINFSDLTSGYRVYKREVLEAIVLDKIKSSSYDFQLEMLAKAIKKGFKIGSVPMIFHDRKYGKSKLTKVDQLRFLITALKIRFGIL